MDDIDHEAVEDLAAFDSLPPRLRKFCNETPLGMDCPTIKELYEKKQKECWADDDDPISMTINVLQVYMAQKGIRDLRPLVPKRTSKRRGKR